MADVQPKVLVVDDERFFREAIRDALAEAGIDAETLETGAQALEAALDPQVGVVVLDVTLADQSGIEVLRRLRAERPALRVIMLSAHADEELVLEALRLDASDYLAKPLHDEELVLAVRRALAGFDVESGFVRLRERIRRLERRIGALSEQVPLPGDAAVLDAFAAAAADAVADVLDAGKTSLMLYDPERNELSVAAATGSPLAASEMDPVALGQGVAGLALSLGEAVIVDDVYTDDRFSGRTLHERYESSSLAVAPLRTDGRPLGVLCATDRIDGAPFGEDELTLLRILAGPVTRFLDVALLPAPLESEDAPEPPIAVAGPIGELRGARVEPEDADDDAEMAREICDVLTREIEPERVLAGALRPALRRLGAEAAAIHLIDNASGELVLEAQAESDGPDDRERLPRLRGLTAIALQTGALVATGSPERDPRFDPQVDTPADGGVRPFLCAPLRLRGKVLGVFRAFLPAAGEASLHTGEVLVAVLSAAVRNVLLYRSLLDSIDEVAEARREAGGTRR